MVAAWGTMARVQAQDPVYSQFYAAPLQLNPALTGLTEGPSFYLNYRNQWAQLNRAFATYSAAYSQYSPTFRSGFGMQLLADVAGNGIYNTYQVGLSYAYDLRFTENNYVRVGLEGNYINKRLNWNKLVFLDQLNPATGAVDNQGNPNQTGEIAPNLPTIGYVDLGLGMLYRSPHWYAGFAFKHLNAPKEGYLQTPDGRDELPLRMTFHAGGEINLTKTHNKRGKRTFISPNILFTKQRQFHQLNLGAYIQMDQLLGGLWTRHTFGNADALIFMVGFQQDFFKVAYSYDLTISRLGTNSGGAHEISLILSFEPKKGKTNYNDCLQIFR